MFTQGIRKCIRLITMFIRREIRLMVTFIEADVGTIQHDDGSGCCWGLYRAMLELCRLIVKFVQGVPKFM